MERWPLKGGRVTYKTPDCRVQTMVNVAKISDMIFGLDLILSRSC